MTRPRTFIIVKRAKNSSYQRIQRRIECEAIEVMGGLHTRSAGAVYIQ
jgi:glycerol-3-phosphate responsive antiterminator